MTISTRLILPLVPSRESMSDQIKNEPDSLHPSTESSEQPVHRLSLSQTDAQEHGSTAEKSSPTDQIVVRIEVTDTGSGIRPADMDQSNLFCGFLHNVVAR